jgi:Txe/YoeB family toxin of Txe-Axe toxin-antitoxin module
MSKLYEEYKWSELVNDEVRKYNGSIIKGSLLDGFLELAKEKKEKDPTVYIIDRSLLREIVKCVLTDGYKIQDQQVRLEYCVNEHYSELPADIKDILKRISEDGIPQEKIYLDKILQMYSKSLEDFIDLRTQNIATGYTFWGPSRTRIVIIKDELFSESDPSLATHIHEYVHSTDKDQYGIRPKIEPTINYVVDNYIKPYNHLYKEYDNKELRNWILNLETTAELATIYILQDSDLIEPIINRKEFLEKKLYQIKQLKEKTGISKIPREDTILAYLIGHFIFEQKDKNDDIREISEKINKIIEDVLRSYIKDVKNKSEKENRS